MNVWDHRLTIYMCNFCGNKGRALFEEFCDGEFGQIEPPGGWEEINIFTHKCDDCQILEEK